MIFSFALGFLCGFIFMSLFVATGRDDNEID